MFTFPEELAPVLFQYPTYRTFRFNTQVMSFVGGEEQRYAIGSAPLRRWQAQSTLLSGTLLSRLSVFFQLVAGAASSFAFTDPWDGSIYPVCYFEADQLTSEMAGEDRFSVSITILEGRLRS